MLSNNLLYDFSQTAIPTDEVDPEWLARPRKWEIGALRRFILYIGPISSIFDYMTYFIMLYVFNCWNNPALVPYRLVRGVLVHPDVDHSRHPHEQDPLHRKPGEQAVDPHLDHHRRGWRLVDRIAPGSPFWVLWPCPLFTGLSWPAC